MQLLFFIIYVIEALIALMYYHDNFKMKRSYLITVGTVLGLYALGFVGNILDKNTNYINGIIFFIINLAFGLICFEMSLKGALFHSVILYAMNALTEILVEATITSFVDVPIIATDVYQKSVLFFIIEAVIMKTLYLLVCKLISFFYSYKNRNSDKSTFGLFVLPVIIATMMILMLNASAKYDFSEGLNLALAILSVLSMIFTCFIFIYNRYVQNQQQELAALQQQSLKNEMDMQYLNLLEQKNQAMQILTHDYKNHLFALRNMGGAEQQEYIDRITKEMNESRNTCHSGNHTLDIIINKYVTECELKGITFDFEIKLSNLSFVSDYDLVTILGNLLDNALEAAQQSEAKTITFKTNKINTYDSVMITNSCDTPPDKNLITTKQNKKLHGVGLKSVTKTLKQYGGELEWEYNSDKREFVATVILLNKEA